LTEFSFSRIEGQVGIAVETTEGTAKRDPSLELFVLKGNTPSLDDIIDKETEIGAYNEPYLRKKVRGTHHIEGELPGVLLAPNNGVHQMIKTAFGNSWYSNVVTALTMEDGGGATFSRGDKIFGETSKAIGEVVNVVDDTLWLVGVQGTFGDNEKIFIGVKDLEGVDSTKKSKATGALQVLTGYYCHKMDAVLAANSTTDSNSTTSSLRIYTTATKAMIADFCMDFRPFVGAAAKRKNVVTVTDDAGVSLEGWIGESQIMAVDYDGGTAAFTVGKTLTSGGEAVGVILAIDGSSSTGTLWVDTTGKSVICADDAVLADDGDTPGAAVVNMPQIPGYLNNAVQIYTDRTGTTKSWNGDVSTFDETDKMSFSIQQQNFDQESLTVFVKDAGSPTKAARGVKISEFSFNVDGEDYGYTAGLLGRTYGYPTNVPAFPACNVTTNVPYGAYSRTIEVDGSTDGIAGNVLDYNFNASFEFSAEKGTTLNDGFPTFLQPTEWGIVGTLNAQFLDDALIKKSWGATDATGPQSGDRLTAQIYVSLDSGEAAISIGEVDYNHILIIGTLGTITVESIDRADDGFVLPVTVEGVMLAGTDEFKGPAQFMIFDSSISH